MKIKIKLSFAILVFIITNNAIAAADQVYNRTITHIATYATFAIIYYSPNFNSTQGCSTGSNNSGVIRFDSNQKKEMYASLLSAATTNQNKVGFGISGCDTGSNLNRPVIYRVDVFY